MFHGFFNSLAKVEVLNPSFHFLSALFRDQRVQQSPQFCKFSFFLLITISSGLLAEIRWSICMSKSHKRLCVSFSRRDAGLCIYHLFIWSNSNFLHYSQWITLPTQSYIVLYSFWANLLHSLMWLMVSSLAPHNLHLLFCCVLSILALIWLVLIILLFTWNHTTVWFGLVLWHINYCRLFNDKSC